MTDTSYDLDVEPTTLVRLQRICKTLRDDRAAVAEMQVTVERTVGSETDGKRGALRLSAAQDLSASIEALALAGDLIADAAESLAQIPEEVRP